MPTRRPLERLMRDRFPGYYRPSEQEFAELWAEALLGSYCGRPSPSAVIGIHDWDRAERLTPDQGQPLC
jgi:hypothetical protein